MTQNLVICSNQQFSSLSKSIGYLHVGPISRTVWGLLRDLSDLAAQALA
jgi:hypothetical protein